jgi:cation diffusion facilitator CzcD-associated flavoprotein CzcO
LRRHFNFGAECLGAEWQGGKWKVHFKDVSTGKTFTKECEVFLSAVGGFAKLREPRFPGLDQFEGPVFHTADWDHSFDWHGKRVAVIGNGCSAAQVVPSIAPGVKKLTQYARSPQWYHPRPNKIFSRFEKFCFRYLPLWQRWYRLDTFLKTDQLASVYGSDQGQINQRLALEEEARQYIYSQSPKKYHHFIVPDFPLGCKRRIYDPGYLASLHRNNVELLPEGVRECTKTGIVSSETEQEQDFDAIILATGFDVSSFLAPMKVVGKNGISLHDQWKDHRGAQAYMGTFVHNFPNLGIMYVLWKIVQELKSLTSL